mgnify:CR=1 FL=1
MNERHLRLAAMLCGTVAVLAASTVGIDGAVAALGGTLVGFSVGAGFVRGRTDGQV